MHWTLHLTLAAALAGGLGACTLTAPERRDLPRVYDFGPPLPLAGAPAGNGTKLRVLPVAAPAWLNGPALYYRLAYDNAQSLQPYARSRWVAAPPALLTTRLRQAAAPYAPTQPGEDMGAYGLQVELEEFSQIFGGPQESRVVVRATAALTGEGGRELIARRSFGVEKTTTTADAEGAVRAFQGAADELITDILRWAGRQAPSTGLAGSRPENSAAN